MPGKIMTIRAPEELIAAFRRKLWGERRQKPSVALRGFMQAVVGGLTMPAAEPTAPSAPLTEPRRKLRRPALVGTYVTVAEHQEIIAAAAPYGGIAPWLRGAIDARLGKVSELPARDEIKALYAATTELWNVGRNLNQVARHLNEAKRAGLPLPVEELRPEFVVKLAKAVDRLAERTDNVIAAAKKRGFGRE